MKCVQNLVRACMEWPQAYTLLDDMKLKILRVESAPSFTQGGACGEVIDTIKNYGPVVQCGDGAVVLTLLKPENRAVMTGADFINGGYIKAGIRFS